MPGGCAIGARPIDIHLKGFEALGVKNRTGSWLHRSKCSERFKGH